MNIIGPMGLNPAIIDKNLFTLVIDGGANHKINFLDSISMGDQDSSQLPLDQVIPSEKDYSDLSYGLRHIPNEIDVINCYGLIGGRLDHQLCVYGDILNHINLNPASFYMYSGNKRSVALIPKGNWDFNHIGSFSVLSVKPQRIKLTGEIKYKAQEEYTYVNPLSSHTLSNESKGKIIIQNEFPLCIFFNFKDDIK